jgi:protein associated with RNAse G/E
MNSRDIWVRATAYDGAPHWVHSARLIQHESGIVVVATDAGTEVQTTRGAWQSPFHTRGHYWPDRYYNVIRLEEDRPDGGRRLNGFYCNIATPVRFNGVDLGYVDLQLDVRSYVLEGGGLRYEVVDEDEFAEAKVRFAYPEGLVASCWRAVDELVALIEARRFPFDTWLLRNAPARLAVGSFTLHPPHAAYSRTRVRCCNSKEVRVQVTDATDTTMTIEAAEESFRTVRCKHHWLIAEPNGPTSRGVCKRCGAVREFYNNPDAAVLNADTAQQTVTVDERPALV